MPTYTYECQKCHRTTDVFHAMTQSPRVKCPFCGSSRMKRLLGTGAGIIFKGSGFYETDYKNGRKKGKATEEKPAKTETAPKSEAAAKADTAGKTESSGKKKPDSGKAA
ncbi:MAG: FmdB family zinc ribbon protein [Candidatus Hydrogenedentes bacterium]|nr:FmdB family zinc ribbon protein [Candidatus Hydrogenedentota bacterium]